MNKFPIWKYLLILLIVSLGVVYSLPNIYAPDPAIQVSGSSASFAPTQATLDTVSKRLDELGIEHFGEELSEKNILVRLKNQDDQMRARREVEAALGENYVVAVNLAATTPEWLQNMGATPMSLGLDLAGGVHFLMEVDTPKVLKDTIDSLEQQLKREIRKNNLRGVTVRAGADGMRVTAKNEDLRETVYSLMRKEMTEVLLERFDENGVFGIKATLSEQFIREKEDYAVNQNLTTLRNRVNEIGVAEPLVQRQGRNRIVVQLPGIQDASDAKKILGKTANLEFRLEAGKGARLSQKEKFPFRNERDQAYFGGAELERQVLVYGKNVMSASATFDPQTSSPQVSITLDGDGATQMSRGTRSNIGRRMGVLFIEYKPVTRIIKDAEGNDITKVDMVAEKEVISLATIQAALGKNFVITGLDSPQEASELALLLRAGALAAPMTYVEERTIGPSLGAENIALGVKSVQIGLALVLIFMLVYYKVFGIFANVALAGNLILIVAVMSMLGATLTLPGIAGIVLTVGMAVDANVLIFSRIREELKNGMPIQSAIKSGYDRAFVTILDANLTTLIVAVILYAIGSGPVKGFAVTLSVGIMTSMFTAIMGTRALVNLSFGGRQLKKLWI
ncbi:protein translocase subunit SecD [Agaribacterium haliotis]|uniref:protein translocase subunit SecD n=1 Tax=Agaribacterium haliotis TaxID=2013869 RepID=UPI000BB57B9B|nr:protein translocase subunit SecD [Agaribacterium haliotis]